MVWAEPSFHPISASFFHVTYPSKEEHVGAGKQQRGTCRKR